MDNLQHARALMPEQPKGLSLEEDKKQDQIIKRSVGRPKLSPEQRKPPKERPPAERPRGRPKLSPEQLKPQKPTDPDYFKKYYLEKTKPKLDEMKINNKCITCGKCIKNE